MSQLGQTEPKRSLDGAGGDQRDIGHHYESSVLGAVGLRYLKNHHFVT